MPCYIPFLRSGSLGIPPEFFPLRLYSDCLSRLDAETASVTVEKHTGGFYPSVSADFFHSFVQSLLFYYGARRPE